MLFRSKRSREVVAEATFLTEEKIPMEVAMEELFYQGDEVVQRAMLESIQATYHGICCKDARIVTEGFKDLANKAYEFFKNILKKVMNFISNTIGYISSYIQDFEKFIEKYKDNVSEFKPFDVEGFTYTISASPVDNCGLTKIVTGFNTTSNKLKSMSLGDIQAMIAKEANKDQLSELRAKIAGASGSIKEDKFASALYKQYRGEKDSKHTIKVDHGSINNMISEFKELKKIVKEVEAEGRDLQGVFNDIIDFFKSMPQYEYTGSDKKVNSYKMSTSSDSASFTKDQSEEYSNDYYKKVTAYYNFCFKLSKDISAMYSKAYTAKVMAIKEAIGFNRSVIRKALSPFASKESSK